MTGACGPHRDRNESVLHESARGQILAAILTDEIPMLRARARTLLPTGSDAEDLLHDTVERALRSQWLFEPGTNHRGWLLKIMQNLFYDLMRGRNRKTIVMNFEGGGVAPGPDLPPEPEPLWTKTSVAEVRELAERLSEPIRTTLKMVLFEGISYQETAKRLGIPVGTVGTRVLRGRRQLRRRLQQATSSYPNS